jgi:hypothetical protein
MNFVGSIPRGRPGISGFQGKSGFSGFSGFSGYSGYSGYAPSTPPLPAFSNVVLAVALTNFNPVGYAAGVSVLYTDSAASQGEAALTEIAPYPINWQQIIETKIPPYLVDTWYDQNELNDLVQSSTARPTLQITTPVIVSGAGTSAANGTYTYRGQAFGRAYYNLVGQLDDPTSAAMVWNGDAAWNIYDIGGANVLYQSSNGDVAFPWLAVFAPFDGSSPAPTVTAGTQQGQIQFNGTNSGLLSSGALYSGGSATGTVYGWIQPESLIETGIIFETNTFADRAHTIKQVSIRMVAGVLTASVFDQTAITALPNSKAVTLATTDPIFITFQWDTAVATPSLQTTLLINNAATGVSSPASADLSGLLIGDATLNVGARNNANSSFLTANMWALIAKNVVDNATVRGQWYAYQQYLKSLQS